MRDSPTTRAALHNLEPMVGHDGLSGADLYSARLADGTSVIVKRSITGRDVFQDLLGHQESLELMLWREGVFSRLPSGIASAILGGWTDEDSTWIVMRDLRGRVIGADHRYLEHEAERLLERLGRLHRSGLRPRSGTTLDAAVGMFSSARVALVPSACDLHYAVDAGWEAFRALAPPALADSVIALAQDPRPLVRALRRRPSVFCHGDVAGVNMAWDDSQLVLLDWGQATFAPPAFDIARFLPSGLRASTLSNDDLIAIYRTIAGSMFDPIGLELSLLAAFVWYGWQKSLDATVGSNSDVQRWEVERITWWCDRLPFGLRMLG